VLPLAILEFSHLAGSAIGVGLIVLARALFRRVQAAYHISFWLLVAAFTLLILSLFMPGGGPAAGWTLYPPLVLQTGDALPLAIFAIHLAGASSIMGAINIIVTIMNMRAPGMTLLKMPLFVVTWLIAYLLIAVMPVFAGAVDAADDHFFATTFLRPPAA
jgi:cytochrome c oxidase subunit 1